MSEEPEFEGADLDEALESASSALGVPAQTIRYRVLESGRRGLFGIGARAIRIRILSGPDSGVPPGAPAPASKGVIEVEESVRRMVGLAGLDLHVAGSATDGVVKLVLEGPDRELLTQREGELLSALQFLLNRMARRTWPEAGHVVVECEGYRDRREDDLADLAREVARQVGRTGRPSKLRAMNPYERRVVHVTLREFPGVTSHSVGEGFLKQVTVSPAPRRERG